MNYNVMCNNDAIYVCAGRISMCVKVANSDVN